jgi:glycerate 2-kinase
MNILIAPDKFKGTLSAMEVCDSIERGLLQNDSAGNLSIRKFPLADGGEGTLDIFHWHTHGRLMEVTVHDPLLRKITSSYALSGDGKTAFIEMASASGLGLLRAEEQDPLQTTTFGTGEMILDALKRNVDEIILGIGGSATNDAALGAIVPLGGTVLDKKRNPLSPRGATLTLVDQIDVSKLHPRLKEILITAICDVTNPFYGAHGAAFVYAPQKGASSQSVVELDEGLQNVHHIIKRDFGLDLQQVKGAGAGGGFAGGLCAFLGAQLKPGTEVVFEITKIAESLEWADIVITGEGKLDKQTMHGKLVAGISQQCNKLYKKVLAVCGVNQLASKEWQSLGLESVHSLSDFAGEKKALQEAAVVLETLAANVLYKRVVQS